MDVTQCGRAEVVREDATRAVSREAVRVNQGDPCAPVLVLPNGYAALASHPPHRQELHHPPINKGDESHRADGMPARPRSFRLLHPKGRIVQSLGTPEDPAHPLPIALTGEGIDLPFTLVRHVIPRA